MALLLGMALANTAQGSVVFFDGTFNNGDWTAAKTTTSIATISAQQIATGGNPGLHRRVDHQDFNDVLHVSHLRGGAVINPNLTPITSIDFSIDAIAIQNLFGIGVGIYPSFQQSGKTYIALSHVLINSNFAWQTLGATGLTAADFALLDNVNDHPDFSQTGSPVQFGFVTANNNGAPPVMASRAAGFDNWSVTAQTVPEPSALILSGLVGFLWMGRGRRHRSGNKQARERERQAGHR